MAKQLQALQEIDGSHKYTVTQDGKEKTVFVKYKLDALEMIDRDKMPPGLAEKLLALGYFKEVAETPPA